jgi:TetR/AcrR family transcriptional regulator, tetracycline repressor protein
MVTRPEAKLLRGSLSRATLVGAALAYIDEEGLGAFSMRNLAKRLGAAPNALYWHISSREALFAEVSNAVLTQVSLPAPSLPWQAWLRAFAESLRAAMHLHPHVAPLVTGEILSSNKGEFHLVEPVLATLVRAGFTPATAVLAYNSYVGAVLGFVGMEVAGPPTENLPAWQVATREAIANADASVYPTLVELRPELINQAFGVRWESAPQHPMDASFETLVSVLLVGLEQLRSPGE